MWLLKLSKIQRFSNKVFEFSIIKDYKEDCIGDYKDIITMDYDLRIYRDCYNYLLILKSQYIIDCYLLGEWSSVHLFLLLKLLHPELPEENKRKII